LLILDFSEDVQGIRKKLKSSIEILSALQIPLSKCILVLNKVDMVLNTEIEDKLSQLRTFVSIENIIPISASNNYNVQSLKSLIFSKSVSR
jgi:GTP-binding protein HflX